jgi:hypothetical protein
MNVKVIYFMRTHVGSNLLSVSTLLILILIIVSGFVFHAIEITPGVLVACIIIFLLCTLPGHCFVYPVFYRYGRLSEGLIWGSVSGIAISSLILSIIIYFIGWNLSIIFMAIIAVPSGLLGYLFHAYKSPIKNNQSQEKDKTILWIALIIVLAFFYFPFKNVGAPVDDKHVYAWLFGHDFINKTVYPVSLSRGLPLDNLLISGVPINYYYVPFVYPALLYKLFSRDIDIRLIMQLTNVLYTIMAVFSLWIFLSGFARERKDLLILLMLALVSYSYSDLYFLVKYASQQETGIPFLSFLGYSLWGFSGFSHTFYMWFLVAPQATLGVAMMLMVLSLYREATKSSYHFLTIGALLGLIFAIEATMGIMLFLWYGLLTLFTMLTKRAQSLKVLLMHSLSGISAGIIFGILFLIGMYDMKTGQSVLRFEVNLLPLLLGPIYFPLDYGPSLFLGIAGLTNMIRKKESFDHWGYPYAILLLVSFVFVFFITTSSESQFGLQKATRVIPICLLVLTAYFLQASHRSRTLNSIVVALLAIAAPTYLTDNYIASNIMDKGSTFIRQNDLKACNWIKTSLPKDAVVQAEPNHPGVAGRYKPLYYYSLIPNFAERPTAIGEWKVSSQRHSESDEVRIRFHAIRRMFGTDNLPETIRIIDHYHIDYIYVGPLERQLYTASIRKFDDSPDRFNKVYDEDNVSIYQYIRSQEHADRASSR